MVGLDSRYLSRKLNSLSYGEAARVALASSLVMNPDVIILDEPSIYLDSKVLDKLVKLIRMLRDKYNKTVIIMSNDIDFVYRVSDNYILMDDGNMVSSGNINNIISNYNILDNYGMEVPIINRFIDLYNNKYGTNINYTNSLDQVILDVVSNG